MTQIAAPTADQLPDAPPPEVVERPRLSYRQRAEMFLWTRQPKIAPTVMVFFMLPVLFGLGTWQISRLHQKNELIAQVEKTLADAPQDFRLHWPKNADDWKDTQYHAVTLQGRWLMVHAFKLAPRTYEGEVGYQLIVPLRLKDDQVVLVDRGFVPDNNNIMPVNENDLASVTGVARIMETEKPMGMPENIPSRNQWTWLDIEAMGHETGFSRVAPVVVYETRDPSRDSYPIGGQLPLPLTNSHWHYAATWYALAFILLGVYVMSMNPKQDKQVEDKSSAAEEIDPVARRGLYPEATD